jgi:rhamnulose-1-phosphate aldolase
MKTDIASTARYLWSKGWAEAGSGNISVRTTGRIRNAYNHLPEAITPGISVYITTTGSRFRNIDADDIGYLWVGATGDAYGFDLEEAKPTSELIAHLMIHEKLAKTDDKVIVHVHATNSIALGMVAKDEVQFNDLMSRLIEIPIFVPNGFAIIPTLPSGSLELASASAARIAQGKRVLLWQNHGLVVVAKDLEQAIDLVEATEKSAEIALKVLSCK